MTKTFYKIENGQAQVGQGTFVPDGFIVYEHEPQELIDALALEKQEQDLHNEYLTKKKYLDESDLEYTKYIQRGKQVPTEVNQKRLEYIAFCGAYERGELVDGRVVSNPTPTFYLGEVIQKYQQQLFPDWIKERDGYTFEYERLAVVKHIEKDWMSLVDKNGTEPGLSNTWILWEDVLISRNIDIGATVKQEISKATDVTLDAMCGKLELNASGISAGSSVTFRLNNSLINENDVIKCSIIAGSSNLKGIYLINEEVGDGFANITIHNRLGSAQSDALKINFRLFKGYINGV